VNNLLHGLYSHYVAAMSLADMVDGDIDALASLEEAGLIEPVWPIDPEGDCYRLTPLGVLVGLVLRKGPIGEA
jgi:hypothetical protein